MLSTTGKMLFTTFPQNTTTKDINDPFNAIDISKDELNP